MTVLGRLVVNGHEPSNNAALRIPAEGGAMGE